jgi:iron(III) transport system substrate-binding protein
VLVLVLAGCRVELGPPDAPRATGAGEAAAGEVWVYTSLCQPVIDAVDPALREDLPGVEPRWFQSGSEKVAQRFEAESEAGGSPACVLLTSDPFWYAGLADAGRLTPHLPPNVLHLDRGYVDPDGRWVATRVSLMVIGVRSDVPPEDRPASFAALGDAKYAGKVSMPDPLASGTAFTWLAFATSDGWDGLRALHAGGLVAAGGSAAVATRVETGERPVGVLLLENVLSARRRGAPIDPVFPSDGAIAVPGPAAIPAGCPNPSAARAVVDWLLGARGQALLASGDLYPAIPTAAPPRGAPPLAEVPIRPWTPELTTEIRANQADIKEKWTALLDTP